MVRAKLTCATALGFALALAATGCEAHSRVANAVHASPLSVVSATTPRFPVARFETGGTFPQVRDGKLALGAVNMALRAVVASDQRAFEPRARRYGKRVAGHRLPSGYAGYYETGLDRTLVSASTVVVSALIRADKRLDQAVRRHPAAALATAQFALLPNGLAVGVVESYGRDDALVPYRALRPYLSRLGLRLVAGARWPDYRADRGHFSYCRRPGPSWSELSATGDVPCATAREAEREVFSQRCYRSNRCVAAGFTCLAFWDGRYDRPFDYTHHAICHDGRRRIVMDEG